MANLSNHTYSLLKYMAALLITAITTAVLLLVRSTVRETVVVLVFLLPVGLSSALWGLRPGILAAFSSFLLVNYFFLEPYNTLVVHRPQDLLALSVFLLVAVVISQLIGQARNNLNLAHNRELEAARLYELNNVLSGLHTESSILDALINHLMVTFQAQRVEILIEDKTGYEPVFIKKENPVNTTEQQEKIEGMPPTYLIPLETKERLIGEIRLWRLGPPVILAEERLVNAFATQAVSTLERSRLVENDRRAQVLEESDRLKTSLLSSVSHELRTPLATIKAAVTSLRQDDFSWNEATRQELLEAVEEETDHLNQLVGNLLNMSRLEVGALKLERRWNVLSEIIASAAVHQHLQNHFLKVNVAEDLPLVPVDYFLMEQVFGNLISNSVKYSPEGSTISILAFQQDEDTLQVQLSNQSPSLPEEHLPRIFDKFYRVTAADRVSGTGLGLSICKGIIEAHGGKIWAENLNPGVAFKFYLPLKWEGAPPRIPTE